MMSTASLRSLIYIGILVAVALDLLVIWYWRRRSSGKPRISFQKLYNATQTATARMLTWIQVWLKRLDPGLAGAPEKPTGLANASPPEPRQVTQVQLNLTVPLHGRLQIDLQVAQPANQANVAVSGIKNLPEEACSPAAIATVELKTLEDCNFPNRAGWHISPALIWKKLEIRTHSWPEILFGLALLVYVMTRLVGLAHFPIYFFSDEAVQTVLGADFLRDGFRNYAQDLLPTFFLNINKYSLGFTVYWQFLIYILFGKSVWAARAGAMALTLIAAISVSLTLRDIFEVPGWWLGTLLLAASPAWFLHSRTAFETAIMASFYAGFLYFYLSYRYRSPRYLYIALVLAALAFYSYSPGQLILAVTGLMLLFSDFRYHWQQRATLWRASGLALLLALPYLRFQFGHPGALSGYLLNLDPYWGQPVAWSEKLTHFVQNYVYYLSPGYWFIPNQHDGVRHLMKGFGHLYVATLPFALAGLFLALKRFRSARYRVLLVALMATPVGAALVDTPSSIPRTLSFIIPATLLTALGLNAGLAWLESRLERRKLAWTTFGLISVFCFYMLADALLRGPTWFQDYGLDGMQYGAQQVFTEIRSELSRAPATEILVSPNWGFNEQVVARFFLDDPLPIQMGNIMDYIQMVKPLQAEWEFVMTASEYQQALASQRFAFLEVHKMLPYPNGQPGFYFVHTQYVPGVQAVMAAEEARRTTLQSRTMLLNGLSVRVNYSRLDIGDIGKVFDGDPASLARTAGLNPAVVEIEYPQAQQLDGIMLYLGDLFAQVTVSIQSPEATTPKVVYTGVVQNTVPLGGNSIIFENSYPVRKLHIEVLDSLRNARANVHLWEIVPISSQTQNQPRTSPSNTQ